MDLKTGSLYWNAVTSAETHVAAADVEGATQPLSGDVECNVLIVGAGVTGALVAAMLADAGVGDVVILDRRAPASGSTPASTALVQYEIDTPLLDLADCRGVSVAKRAYRASRAALDDLDDLIRRHQIDCDSHWRGSLYLASEPDEYEVFAREAAARQAIGIEVELLTRRQLIARFDLDRPAALFSAAAIELDPVALTFGLLATARRTGRVRIHAPAESTLQSLPRRTAEPIVFACDGGQQIRARHAVFATGYETPEQFPRLRRYCTLKSTYAMASEPLHGGAPWPGRVLLWESARPYFYARQSADHRLIMGGEDEDVVDPTQRDALIDLKIDELCRRFADLCPDIDVRPEFSWAGTFAETRDGLPYIGTPAGIPSGCHFALGYGGNGITFSVIAAQRIRDAILGCPSADGDLYTFDR